MSSHWPTKLIPTCIKMTEMHITVHVIGTMKLYAGSIRMPPSPLHPLKHTYLSSMFCIQIFFSCQGLMSRSRHRNNAHMHESKSSISVVKFASGSPRTASTPACWHLHLTVRSPLYHVVDLPHWNTGTYTIIFNRRLKSCYCCWNAKMWITECGLTFVALVRWLYVSEFQKI